MTLRILSCSESQRIKVTQARALYHIHPFWPSPPIQGPPAMCQALRTKRRPSVWSLGVLTENPLAKDKKEIYHLLTEMELDR